MAPNIILSLSLLAFRESYGIDILDTSKALGFKAIAGFSGIWLAWFTIKMKNHHLLFLYVAFTLAGLLLIYFIPTVLSLSIGSILIGFSSGAIYLAVPSFISGGRGGSEMFVVSFGLVTFLNSISIVIFPSVSTSMFGLMNSVSILIIVALVATCLGAVLLIPVKSDLFNGNPPLREFSFAPVPRDPSTIILLCLIPIYNIYYLTHISYRLHGEINSINRTQNILSPKGAAWCTLLVGVLSPIMVSSLNTTLLAKRKEKK